MSLYKKKFNPLAWKNIKDARKWYGEISPELAKAFNKEISDIVAQVAMAPFSFGVRFLNVRRVNFERFPYAFHFTIVEKSMTIVFINFFHIKTGAPYSDLNAPDNYLNEP